MMHSWPARFATERDLDEFLSRPSAALIERATETETPLPGVFDLMLDLLRHLSSQPAQPHTLLAFELKLLLELGLIPDLAESKLSPVACQLVNALTRDAWPLIARLRPHEAQLRELEHFLRGRR